MGYILCKLRDKTSKRVKTVEMSIQFVYNAKYKL